MQIQPEIAFHNCEKVDWAEDQILDHIERLEEIYDRLITCRVRVDQRNDNPNHTIPPVVRIEISVPGHKDIVVAHEPGPSAAQIPGARSQERDQRSLPHRGRPARALQGAAHRSHGFGYA